MQRFRSQLCIVFSSLSLNRQKLTCFERLNVFEIRAQSTPLFSCCHANGVYGNKPRALDNDHFAIVT